MRRLCLVVLGLALAPMAPPAALACSMCQCGDPTFSLVGSQVFVPGTWHFGLDAGRYTKDQVSEEDVGAREEEVEDRLTLSASRTSGERLTVVAQLPFAHRRITVAGEESTLWGRSDPELVAHYRLYAPRAGSWVSASLGVRTGWGENDAVRGGVRAEEHLQPGTGAWGLQPGLGFAHVMGGVGSLFGSVGGRFNGRNDAGYHYGSVLLANLGYERRLASRLNAVLEANFRRAGKDEPVTGETDPNTGGSVLYLSPRLLVKLDRSLFLRLGVQVPVVKGLYGDQDEKVNFLSGLTVRF